MPKRVRTGEHYLLAPGESLPGKEQYRIEAYLGQGAFAAAYRAVNEAGDTCFIKEYFPAGRPSEAPELARVYATERDVVRRLGNYELIPRFRDAFQYEGFSYLVTDFIPGPDLESVLRSGQKPDMEVLVRWAVCLCHELAFIHKLNVVHHDLKPANIRLNQDGDPVLVDFSAAHWYRRPGETTDQLYGSDSYLAPEFADRSVEDAEAGKKMDVFAMGRILVELMVGERLSQDEINRRHDQLYGQILHSGKLDISFVRSVFRSVAYDPERRYSSGVELAEDILPAAPPVGRVRPTSLDFGVVTDTTPREMVIQCYNVGGGTLRGEVAADAPWIEIGASGAVLGAHAMFERNRQAVRVVVYPERMPAGSSGSGRVVITFPSGAVEVPVLLQRTADVSQVSVQPESLRVNVQAGGEGVGRLVFANDGNAPAAVRVERPPDFRLAVEPAEFVLPPRGRQEVAVTIDSQVLGDAAAETQLRWSVDGNPRPGIPLNAGVRRGGLVASLTDRFRKKG
ncbi:MAG: serine/threonine protein kinase [Armatimonadota bacterium]